MTVLFFPHVDPRVLSAKYILKSNLLFFLVLFYQIRDLKGYFILLLYNFDIVVVWYDVM